MTVYINIAEIPMALNNIHDNLCVFFDDFYIDRNHSDAHKSINLKNELIHEWIDRYGYFNDYAEFNVFHSSVGNALLEYDRCMFHSVAMKINNKAWLLTGKSGIGKTTQYKNLIELHPSEIHIINGDKPVIQFRQSDIYVHPSPWNGKENMFGYVGAELGGIIVLKQGKINSIHKLTPREASLSIFSGIIQTFDNEIMIKTAASMAERLIRKVPIYQLVNLGDNDSSELLYKTIMNWEFL